jgi:hypothetical protein
MATGMARAFYFAASTANGIRDMIHCRWAQHYLAARLEIVISPIIMYFTA